MELMVLDRNLDAILVVEEYESIIWTDRYNEYGRFELHTSVSETVLKNIKQDYYLYNRDSEHLMIVDEILIKSDADKDNTVTIQGKSLESILTRRIVWGQFTMGGNLQNAIKELINVSIINPSDADRKIENFIFEETDDPDIIGLTISAQYTGDVLYDIIQKICDERKIGFKITLNDNKQFVFKLFKGKDRTYDQTDRPFVIFSPEFDNLVESNYIESNALTKNVTLVGGEDPTNNTYYESSNEFGDTAYIGMEKTKRRYVSVGSASGLDRRELFTDARDIQSEQDGVKISDEEYTDLLKQRGKEKLAENEYTTSFEGSIVPDVMYKLNRDYFIGDIVQIANEYGHSDKVRILEIAMSEDAQGFSMYPTFSTIKDEEDDNS